MTRRQRLMLPCRTYLVNVLGGPRLISLRAKTIHHCLCRYATLSRRCYSIDAAEVMRQHGRIQRGDGGRAKICGHCRPDKLATLMVDTT